MIIKNVIRSTFIVKILLLCVLLSACGGSKDNDIYWFTDPPDTFRTNDIKKAQNEIPFHITLPTYLPDNFKSLPDINGPLKGTAPENDIEIKISYRIKHEGYYVFSIKEENEKIIMYPPAHTEVNYTNIAGVQVMDWEYLETSISSSGTELHQAIEFVWDQNGVHFEVTTSGYAHEEAIKIVESIINQ